VDKLALSYLTVGLSAVIQTGFMPQAIWAGIWVTFCGFSSSPFGDFGRGQKGFHEMNAEHRPDIIPFSIYLISLLYALISVALPFSYFSSNSIFREF
jgi:hypothetical protein